MRLSFRRGEEPLALINNMCNVHPQTCLYSCGNQCAQPVPNESANETFEEVTRRMISRRRLLGGGAVAAGLLVVSGTPLGRIASARAEGNASAQAANGLTFTPISLSNADEVLVAPGYSARTLIRWGDPLFTDAPKFEHGMNTAADQARQFGYNCDYLGYIPIDSKSAMLIANHEYTNPDLMFPGYDPDAPTKDQVDVELQAHGLAVVFIERNSTFGWRYVIGAWPNRRITATTPILLTGPAAGHPLLKTTADPSGSHVLGMLNNCSAGITPWGTVLTCEENFNQYFANQSAVADPATKAVHKRYGLTSGASSRKWEDFYDRFDLSREPNEAFRFGWVVEIDPHDPGSAPKKRTALGRFKHEATTTVLAKDNRVVVYMGDDERFDYVYKFVSKAPYKPGMSRQAAGDLLDQGTLYVARFHDDNSGSWIPLVWGSNGLTSGNGFGSQAEVLIKARLAGDTVGATKMDRPEDIEVNPVNGKIYAAMTNNTQRGTEGKPGVDASNPRPANKHGQILELTPGGGDHGAGYFSWDFFMLCGDPAKDEGTYFAGFDQKLVSPISSPDNIAFDNNGNLWISTDGQTSTFKMNDGVYAVPTAGPERGYVRQFLSGVPGGECASLVMDDTNTTLFVSIQHPGEDSSFDSPSSTFPDGTKPRPSVVLVQKDGGGTIGS